MKLIDKLTNPIVNFFNKFNLTTTTKKFLTGTKEISKILLYFSIGAFLLTGTAYIGSQLFKTSELEYEYVVFRSMSELHYYSTKDKTIGEINNYIDSVAPNSSLNGIAIFEECDKYNIDICFVLAQAQIESCFGTSGIASKTNSVWNVLAYDGRTADDMINKGHGYDHPDKSIIPYLTLLTNKYLAGNKTEYDLMNNFKSVSGHRYASDPSYEKKILKTYNHIKTNTNILKYYNEYKKYKIMLNTK